MPAEGDLGTAPVKVKRKTLRWSREPLTRVQVVAIWAFVAIMFAATKNEDAWRFLELTSCACFAFFLWPFVQGPYLVLTRHKNPLRLEYRRVESADEPVSPQYRVAALTSLGFKSAGQLVQASEFRNVQARLELFLHEANKDSAQLTTIEMGLKTIHLLVFKTRFEDGFAYETSDGHTAPVFKPDPNYRVFRFPDIRATGDLYRLHCEIKKQFSDRRPTLADGEGEMAQFIARAQLTHQRHSQSGDFKLSPAGDCYRYTWKGAIRHAWLLAWPIQPLRHMRLHRQGIKMAERLGLPIHPKFGRLQESVVGRNSTA